MNAPAKHKRCSVCVNVFFFDAGDPARCPKCEVNDAVIPFLPMPAVKHNGSEKGQLYGLDYGTIERDRRRKV